MNVKKNITPQKENFSEWYQDVVKEAELAENSEVRGCGIVRPYGYKIWELIKAELSRLIEETGVENVYFPIFIPMENLEAEKDHVEGFSPELAVVTHGGGEKLVNKLAVRPTSETSMYKTYAKWIQSYKDLPLRLNQWNNVVRWEKRPRPFLRWSEFLWQEGHTVFAKQAEAEAEMWQMLDVYEKTYQFMALPVMKGKKSEAEKFAGAVMTTTAEIMVKDGKAIQGGTSHYLGTNFAKVFDVTYLGDDGERHFCHQNSWGFSWRSVGAVIMAHGDDNGLRLPPNIAPIQIVIVPIYKDENKQEVIAYAEELKKELTPYRVKLDARDGMTPGFKFNHWEVKGVPVRLEIGQKEKDNNEITIFRRDNETKIKINRSELKNMIPELFKEIHISLYDQAKDFSEKHIHRIESIDEIKDQVGFFEASWCESKESEKLLKEKFSMVSRVLPFANMEKESKNKKCFITGAEAKHDWLFAKSY
ncbi:MAG: Proline-tRNA ligase [Candidatus Falkowbacteria bacterium GW2011_GWC2_38_22]|uniref:Proline--tRNA ligase n=1 Tax=Candidatus Falkowbacteria bacterium GW2011_GWE1_38_31 TaxID=1618638 RepID=A0A0G0K4I0_9BACT|nr:MAG: Proline-tRNA ligase [Candidatus Falkowbacteria bacterium GW2011_GWF2_38_1205]KKQ61516.1 MAG: Proline-tRNA ligase [Candidatus Falkowbacteria bacterium GW2011_GWC2_38_22]KKQ63591.1 MAG: Proline-tRNA ligase [Candidatus Falkowbacteria bacterium GW2011_GWF1_38_22]KKQ65743.1 MAG: Proline-tRNA ligase [Candidatus Falkowbacteria bacterium GW2011_GWE2_38_254]KKQ70360.1 MAG: Proline-tRNA ligase [Candidatus Falkowbacteria bacterium GW2011_GWE1_38_31]KKQ72865.1 MAG: Proline-tRNA ligase [Candidatus 